MLRLVWLLVAFAAFAQEPFDIVIAHGTVLDGSGAEGRRVDVGVRAGRIAAIGDLSSAARKRTIDAAGFVVAPGFLDMHNHSDDSLVDEPKCESMIRQGVTTMVLGEGESAGPAKPGLKPWTSLGGYFDFVADKGVAENICSYVGETQVWTHVKGFGLTPATAAEMEGMKREIACAMEEGAMGLSSSLLMPPSNLATTDQLVEMARVAAEHGGIYATHIRDEGTGVFRAIAEAIAIGRRAKIRVDILHLKIADRTLWGRMDQVVAMIDKARAEGCDIRANVYPYTAGQNDLVAIIPPWAHDGGTGKLLERLRDPAMRARMRRDILNGLPGWYNHYLAIGNWEDMLLVSFTAEKNKPFAGKRMSELIRARGGEPVEVLFDVLLEEGGSVPTVYFHHREPDMQLALKQPFTSVGSDGLAMSPEGPLGKTRPHPRSYGTFPRVLGRYTRELKVLTLAEAVHKITAMNADKIGIRDRGLLKAGFHADVTVFDPNTVADQATYLEPHRYPTGIPYVLVNGVVVLDNGRHTGALPGQVIRGPGYRRSGAPSHPAAQ